MTRSTVLLGPLPRMMRSIMAREVASQADLQLVDEGEDVDLEAAVTRSGADVLIVEEQADRDEAYYRQLCVTHPSLRIFILTQDGRNVMLMGFRRARLVDASSAALIEAIRAGL